MRWSLAARAMSAVETGNPSSTCVPGPVFASGRGRNAPPRRRVVQIEHRGSRPTSVLETPAMVSSGASHGRGRNGPKPTHPSRFAGLLNTA